MVRLPRRAGGSRDRPARRALRRDARVGPRLSDLMRLAELEPGHLPPFPERALPSPGQRHRRHQVPHQRLAPRPRPTIPCRGSLNDELAKSTGAKNRLDGRPDHRPGRLAPGRVHPTEGVGAEMAVGEVNGSLGEDRTSGFAAVWIPRLGEDPAWRDGVPSCTDGAACVRGVLVVLTCRVVGRLGGIRG